MTSFTAKIRSFRPSLRNLVLAAAVVGATAGATALPAFADSDDWGHARWDRHEEVRPARDRDDWRDRDEWRDRDDYRPYAYYQSYAYVAPGFGYAMPAPPPAYVAPVAPSLNFVFPFTIR